MKSLSLIIILFFSITVCTAQRGAINVFHDVLLNEESRITTNPFGLTDAQLAATKGSPYESESFVKGSIYVKGKMAKKDVLVRYNILQSTIEIKDSEMSKEYWPLARQKDVFVKTMPNDVYVFVPNKTAATDGDYFKILVDGKSVDLYKNSRIRYVDAYVAKTSMETSRPAKFVQSNVYYAVNKRGDFLELPQKSKKIYSILSGKNKELKTFIKKNKISLKDEKDMIKLVAYYNSLF